MVFIGNFNLWISLLIIGQTSAISFNQPNFSSNSLWSPNATTVANITTIGSSPYDIFINTNNTIYVPNQDTDQIIIWSEGNLTSTTHISGNLLNSSSLFVTTTGDIHVDTFHTIGGVSQITLNLTIRISRMNMCQQCWDIFIDISNMLYCSLSERHQIIAKSLTNDLSRSTIVGGTGSAGLTSTTLNNPRGIFVDITLNLYVADCGNNRIQLFRLGQLNATTIVGNGSLNITITLNCPTSIILDGNNYLFIVDSGNDRIVGSDASGFRCIIGCSGSSGSASYQLNHPWAVSFDSSGNIFVSDQGNNRIQKFSVMTDSLETTITKPAAPTTAVTTTAALPATGASTIIQQNITTVAGFYDGSCPTSSGNLTVLHDQGGITVSNNGTLYVGDGSPANVLLAFEPNNLKAKQITTYGNWPAYLFIDAVTSSIYATVFYLNSVVIWPSNPTIPRNPSAICDMAHLYYPTGILVDSLGNIYISSSACHWVTKWNPNATNATLVAGSLSAASGSDSQHLNKPYGLFLDENNSLLYVADAANNRVQKFTLGNLTGVTVAGGNGPGTASNQLNFPSTIHISQSDNSYYICDYHNNRIQRWAIGATYGVTIAGSSTGVAGNALHLLNGPYDVWVDPNATYVLISDSNNCRVQKYLL